MKRIYVLLLAICSFAVSVAQEDEMNMTKKEMNLN